MLGGPSKMSRSNFFFLLYKKKKAHNWPMPLLKMMAASNALTFACCVSIKYSNICWLRFFFKIKIKKSFSGLMAGAQPAYGGVENDAVSSRPHILTSAACCCATRMQVIGWRMLTYADVCWRMLTYADVCRVLLRYPHAGDLVVVWVLQV